jgi:hypothetical protein
MSGFQITAVLGNFFLAVPVCCLSVTLDYRIDTYLHPRKQLQHFCYQNILSSNESGIFQLYTLVKVG